MIDKSINEKRNKVEDILIEIIAWVAAILLFSVLGYAFYYLFIK